MRREFISAAPTETLREVDQLMRLGRLRHLPILDGGILVGLVSHRDVLIAWLHLLEAYEIAAAHKQRAQTVASLMKRELDTAAADEPIGDAARRMLGLRVGCLPVVEPTRKGPRMIGLVTESDLLREAYSFPGSSPHT